MDDYISREAAVEALRPYKIDPFKIGFLDDNIDGFNDGIDTAISCISVEVPAADVRPVKIGHYVTDDMGDSSCSECGEKYLDITKRFCPGCGAELRRDEK